MRDLIDQRLDRERLIEISFETGALEVDLGPPHGIWHVRSREELEILIENGLHHSWLDIFRSYPWITVEEIGNHKGVRMV